MSKPIVNISEAQFVDLGDMSRAMGSQLPAQRYGGRMAPLTQAVGATRLGCNITEVAPGKRAFPFHSHRANEELFFVLEGTGELRFGSDTFPVKPGDLVCCPPGGADVAHQFVNTGTAPLKFLAISTNLQPEVCHYPDSGKVAVLDSKSGGYRHVGRADANVDYWEGE